MINLKIIKQKNGFTLLELLIVIAIIAALSVVLIVAINPAEAMKKARDSQRISDLATLKKAIGLYMTTTQNPKLAGIDNVGCKGNSLLSDWQPTDKIYYSYPSDGPGEPITGTSYEGTAAQVTKANLGKTDGTGWLPINFTSLSGGSPISSVPVDPVNKIAIPATPTNKDLIYRYTCFEKDLTYEIDATLESDAFTTTDSKLAKDGGNSDLYYESGTNLGIMAVESFTTAFIGPDGFTYDTVKVANGRIWLDRNLGATRVATSYNDSSAYGYYYQWGRGNDGHQIGTSGTTETLSSSDNPGHSNFIINNDDWRNSPNNSLWQGVNGINNPCPSGFRIPTLIEFADLFSTSGITNSATAYSSVLKFTVGGARWRSTAILYNQGTNGSSWSSTIAGATSHVPTFGASFVTSSNNVNRGVGFPVRCIKN